MHVGERGKLENQRVERSGEPGGRRREHEGDELVTLGLVAERDGALLVFANRLQNFAERRVDDAVDEDKAGEERRG